MVWINNAWQTTHLLPHNFFNFLEAEWNLWFLSYLRTTCTYCYLKHKELSYLLNIHAFNPFGWICYISFFIFFCFLLIGFLEVVMRLLMNCDVGLLEPLAQVVGWWWVSTFYSLIISCISLTWFQCSILKFFVSLIYFLICVDLEQIGDSVEQNRAQLEQNRVKNGAIDPSQERIAWRPHFEPNDSWWG